jgi:hypothetical protein
MTIKTALVVLAALTSAAAVGCADGGSDGSGSNPGDQTKASLHRAKGCDDLLGDLKADAKWKVDHSIDNQIQSIKLCQAHYPDSQCASYGGYIGGPTGVAFSGVDEREATSAPTAANAGSSSTTSGGTGGAPAPAPATDSAGSGSKSASSYSETNTQVKGVDEADIVKNDGSNIYVLHGRAFKVIHAFPATEMKESGSIDIDGTPTEMFVNDGKVVVYSQVNGADILSAANIKPRTQYTDYGYGGPIYATGGTKVATDAPPPTNSGGTAPSPAPTQPQVYVPLTKVTVLALNGSTPVVTRESWFEGSYLDSRRVGTSVRTVFQGNSYGPALKYGIYDLIPPSSCSTPAYDPNTGAPPPDESPQPCTDNSPKTGTATIALLEKLRATNHGIIDASVITDWLPYTFVRQGGGVSASTTQCQDFYVPTTGSTESGITEVSTLDLADPTGTPRETAILGRADTVYGNADSLYVASRAYVEPPVVWYDPWGGGVVSSGGTAVPPTPPSTGGSTGTGTVEPAPAPAPGGIGTESLHLNADPVANAPVSTWSSTNTHVHKFEFKSDPKFGNYQASGTVRGMVKDQFSLDEKDGFLRIATTEQRNYYSTTDNVYVAADSAPVQKGAPAPVRPQSVSHVFVLGQQGGWLGVQGDAGDLAANEQIYSVRFVDSRGYVVTYRQVDPLFVLDLSTPQKPNVVGELTIPGFSEYMHPLDAGHLLTIGRDENRQLALQIFDVTNPASPQRTWNLAYTGGDYASSDAEYDHKAFTYFADKQLLAIPFYSYGYATTTDGYGMHSSLEIFKIDVNAGIQHLGDVDGTALVSKYQSGYCGGYYGPSVRRGVFLDNTVYAISYGGIAAKDVGNLAAPPVTYALPYPQANDVYSGAPMIACAPAPVEGDTGGALPKQ